MGRLDQESHPPAVTTRLDLVLRDLQPRYALERVLRSGDGTLAFTATETKDNQRVVVKAIFEEHLPVAARLRLEQTGARLLGQRTPCLTTLVESTTAGNAVCFISEFQAGQSLQRRFEQGPLDLGESLRIGNAILQGLRQLHRHGIIHRQLSPEHIILTSEGRAILVDPGTAFRLSYDGVAWQPSVDCARYLSPEQAGSIDHDVAAPADLYSVGAILFHCLSGRPPYDGNSLGDILFQHVTAPIPNPAEVATGHVPQVVGDFLRLLLNKDPRDRYQSADAALADLAVILRCLDQGQSEPQVTVGQSDPRITLTEPAFVGREKELRRIEACFSQVRSGRRRTVAVEGESGSGKSRLLMEITRRASQAGFRVFRGYASNEVAQRPLQVLDGIVDAILSMAPSDDELVTQLRANLADHRQLIVSALPKLARLLGAAPRNGNSAEQFQEAQLLHGLAVLLASLGSPEHPALILLDDCQWADQISSKLIRRWFRDTQDNEPCHSLLAIAFRKDEVGPDHALRQQRADCPLVLDPMARDAIAKLAESMAGPLPAEVIDILHHASSGSPFLASAVLRGMVETGALTTGDDGWRLQRRNAGDWQSSDYAARLLAERIGLLRPATVRLISVGAVLGKEFSLELASRVSGLDAESFVRSLEEARQRHLVWLRPSEAQCVFVHDHIRETLLNRLAGEERRALHLSAARVLEATHPDSHADLAFHFDAAGEGVHALPHALAPRVKRALNTRWKLPPNSTRLPSARRTKRIGQRVT